MIKLDLCSICINEDFGNCLALDSRIAPNVNLEYKHDKDSNLIKCSGFRVDSEIINRRFKI